MIRTGVVLPTFRESPDDALEAAAQAFAAGVDGVFCYDHIWPMGRNDRPALAAFPVLGAVASVTERICFGTLVARIGLRPDDVLVAQLASLARMAPGRLIAGMGTGDSKSAAENKAYGIPPGPPDERRLALLRCGRRVLDLGVPVWVGGGSLATTALAAELGPGAAVNLWAGTSSAVAGLSGRFEVTWGGPVATETAEIALGLGELATAGATWAVCAWPESLDALAEVAEMMRGPHHG